MSSSTEALGLAAGAVLQNQMVTCKTVTVIIIPCAKAVSACWFSPRPLGDGEQCGSRWGALLCTPHLGPAGARSAEDPFLKPQQIHRKR